MRFSRKPSAVRRALKSVKRPGTAVVETAVVLPVYVLLLLAIIEFGHAQLVISLLQSGCRNGARLGAMQGPTTAQVIARVNQSLGSAFDASKASVFVRDANVFDTGTAPTTDVAIESMPAIELGSAEPRRLFVVRASVPYNSIALLPMPFLKNVTLDAQSFMRHE